MPLRVGTRFGIGIIVLCAARPSTADDKCAPHGPLQTYVAPNENDATLSRRTLDEILSELQRRMLSCPATEGEPVELEVVWRPGDHVLIRFAIRTVTRELSIERDVDLNRVPADEIPLAVAILADEMFAEVLDRAAAPEPVPPKRVTPQNSVRRAAPAPPVTSAVPHVRFGLRATHQELTSGLGLTGVDVEAAWLVTANFTLAARGGPRAVSWASTPSVHGYAFDVSALAIVGTSAYAPRGIAALMAVDALGIAGTARASPALGAYVWQKLDHRFVLSLDARVGGIFSDPAEFSALSGACVSISAGFATEW